MGVLGWGWGVGEGERGGGEGDLMRFDIPNEESEANVSHLLPHAQINTLLVVYNDYGIYPIYLQFCLGFH